MAGDIEAHPAEIYVTDSGGKQVKAAEDVDAALQFLRNKPDVVAGEATTVDEKKLMRKVDWMIMPLMFACYYLQYTDKTLCKLCLPMLPRDSI